MWNSYGNCHLQQWKSFQGLEDPFLRLLLGWWPLQPFLDSIYIPNLGCLAQKSSTGGSSLRSNHKLPNFQFYSIHFRSSVVFRCFDYRFEQIEPSSLFWVTVTLGFPTGSVVKNPTQETQVPSPHGDNALEKETATLSGDLAWEIPLKEEPGGL